MLDGKVVSMSGETNCTRHTPDVGYWHIADIAALQLMSAIGGKADMGLRVRNVG